MFMINPKDSTYSRSLGKMEPLSIDQVNLLDYEEFIKRFGNVIEHCPICAAAVWRNQPFQNVNELHDSLCNFVDHLPDIGDSYFFISYFCCLSPIMFLLRPRGYFTITP